MFSFFKKKQEQKVEISALAIVFNLANHASLIAATLSALVLRRYTDLNVILVDIRDSIPQHADHYLWLEVGGYQQFLSYCDEVGKVDPSYREFCASLKEKSIFLNSTRVQDRTPKDTIIGMACDAVSEHAMLDGDEHILFSRYALLSENWHRNSIDSAEACSYSKALKFAYGYYNGRPLTVQDMFSYLYMPEDQINEYIEEQKAFNRVVGGRCSLTTVNGKTVQMLTATGPEVYGILRRITISRQQFLHVSTGRYGRIVYSSLAIPNTVVEQGNMATLNLTPELSTS